MLPLLWCFFAHLLILQYPDHHQNLISSSLYYSGPVHKISSQSIHNFLSNVVHRQTNKQTDKLTNATKKHNLLCQGGNKQLSAPYIIYADFEALTTKIEGPELDPNQSNTSKTQHHGACSYCYIVVRYEWH